MRKISIVTVTNNNNFNNLIQSNTTNKDTNSIPDQSIKYLSKSSQEQQQLSSN